MTRYKTIIAASIFVALTLIKLITPSFAASLRVRLLPAIEHDTDFKAAAATLGSAVTGRDGVIASIGKLTGMWDYNGGSDTHTSAAGTRAEATDKIPSPSPARVTGEPRTLEPVTPEPSASTSPEPTPTPVEPVPGPPPAQEETETEAEPEETVPPEVAAFHESQLEFASLDIPANVTYSMPELSIDYTTPLPGIDSSGFGYRMHPIEGIVKFHYGADYPALSGADILAFADGTVITSEYSDSFGNYIVVEHSGGIRTLYAHCGTLFVSAGDTVSKGGRIALVGSTGLATGPHLHFELTVDGVYLNPSYYV